MYDRLIAFLLGRNEEFTDEELQEFIKLLAEALNIMPEFEMFEKRAIVEQMMNSADILSHEDRMLAGNKLSGLIKVEDEFNFTHKRTNRNIKSKPINTRIPISERLEGREQNISTREPGKHAENILRDQPTDSKEIEVNLKLKTPSEENAKPKTYGDNKSGIANVFDEEFSQEEFRKSLVMSKEAIHSLGEIKRMEGLNNTKIQDTNNSTTGRSPMSIFGQPVAPVDSEFLFSLGDLEWNDFDGPEYHFDL